MDSETPDRPGIAIGLLLTAMLAFVAMDAVAKLLAGDGLAPEFMVFWRNSLVLLALVPVLVWRRGERPLLTMKAIH